MGALLSAREQDCSDEISGRIHPGPRVPTMGNLSFASGNQWKRLMQHAVTVFPIWHFWHFCSAGFPRAFSPILDGTKDRGTRTCHWKGRNATKKYSREARRKEKKKKKKRSAEIVSSLEKRKHRSTRHKIAASRQRKEILDKKSMNSINSINAKKKADHSPQKLPDPSNTATPVDRHRPSSRNLRYQFQQWRTGAQPPGRTSSGLTERKHLFGFLIFMIIIFTSFTSPGVEPAKPLLSPRLAPRSLGVHGIHGTAILYRAIQGGQRSDNQPDPGSRYAAPNSAASLALFTDCFRRI